MQLLSQIQRQKPREKPKSRSEQIAERLAETPEIYQGDYIKAVEGKSRNSAIRSFCRRCMGFEREEVRVCTDLACELWAFRPGRHGPKPPENRPVSGAESTNDANKGHRPEKG